MTPFERRAHACQDRMGDADAVVLFPSANLYYASGFTDEPGERHLFLVVPATGDPVFFVPELYETQVRAETWVDDVRTWADEEGPVDGLAALVADLDLVGGHVLVDDTMWARFTLDLRSVLPDTTVGLASEVFGRLRVRKDDAELEALDRAGTITDAVAEAVRGLGRTAIGMTESELAEEIRSLLAENGGTGVSFEPVVASGSNGARPHHRHGGRRIASGDPVVLDFGTRVDSYPSDVTRTVVFGADPPEDFELVHRVVREAQIAGIDAVEPGVPAEAVDRAARSVVEAAGFGDQFVHRTGHGVGLDIHEEPYIVAGNDQPLEPGMVFSVEPGIYLPDRFGVRIEDLVVVTEGGCERLTHSGRGWAC
ncbi:MAG: M24 family metallopeptidase [Halobacteriota archaeon]